MCQGLHPVLGLRGEQSQTSWGIDLNARGGWESPTTQLDRSS